MLLLEFITLSGQLIAPRLLVFLEWKIELWPDKVVRDSIAFNFERRVIEVSEQLVIVTLREGIILVVVALGALDTRAEPDGAKGRKRRLAPRYGKN